MSGIDLTAKDCFLIQGELAELAEKFYDVGHRPEGNAISYIKKLSLENGERATVECRVTLGEVQDPNRNFHFLMQKIDEARDQFPNAQPAVWQERAIELPNLVQELLIRQSLPAVRRVLAWQEATRDPIFLFQYKCFVALRYEIDGYAFDDDEGGFYKVDDAGKEILDSTGYRSYLSNQELEAHEAAAHYWVTDCVFLSREEAEEYGHIRNASYPDGWRSYSVPSKGVLAGLLKSITTKQPDPTEQEG